MGPPKYSRRGPWIGRGQRGRPTESIWTGCWGRPRPIQQIEARPRCNTQHDAYAPPAHLFLFAVAFLGVPKASLDFVSVLSYCFFFLLKKKKKKSREDRRNVSNLVKVKSNQSGSNSVPLRYCGFLTWCWTNIFFDNAWLFAIAKFTVIIETTFAMALIVIANNKNTEDIFLFSFFLQPWLYYW